MTRTDELHKQVADLLKDGTPEQQDATIVLLTTVLNAFLRIADALEKMGNQAQADHEAMMQSMAAND